MAVFVFLKSAVKVPIAEIIAFGYVRVMWIGWTMLAFASRSIRKVVAERRVEA